MQIVAAGTIGVDRLLREETVEARMFRNDRLDRGADLPDGVNDLREARVVRRQAGRDPVVLDNDELADLHGQRVAGAGRGKDRLIVADAETGDGGEDPGREVRPVGIDVEDDRLHAGGKVAQVAGDDDVVADATQDSNGDRWCAGADAIVAAPQPADGEKADDGEGEVAEQRQQFLADEAQHMRQRTRQAAGFCVNLLEGLRQAPGARAIERRNQCHASRIVPRSAIKILFPD